jgi:hypothetical protein
MTTLWTVLCFSVSLAAEPSPPPMMNTVFGLQWFSDDENMLAQ